MTIVAILTLVIGLYGDGLFALYTPNEEVRAIMNITKPAFLFAYVFSSSMGILTGAVMGMGKQT